MTPRIKTPLATRLERLKASGAVTLGAVRLHRGYSFLYLCYLNSEMSRPDRGEWPYITARMSVRTVSSPVGLLRFAVTTRFFYYVLYSRFFHISGTYGEAQRLFWTPIRLPKQVRALSQFELGVSSVFKSDYPGGRYLNFAWKPRVHWV